MAQATNCGRAGSSKIIKTGFDYATVPESMEDSEIHAIERHSTRELSGEDDVRVFSEERQARLWAVLQDTLGESYEDAPISTLADDVSLTDEEDPAIPLTVALSSKAKIAAYLYCSGHSEGIIGSFLDVGDRTVRQYLSDVERGER